jgi:hypothetical protein
MKDSELKKTVITDMQEVTGSELDAKILTDVYQAMDETRPPAVAGGRITIWRMMMKSKITQYATAAVVLIVGIAGLMYFNSTSNGTGVVLAEVIEKMDPVRTIQHREDWTITKVGEDKPMKNLDVYKYCSTDHGIVVHVHLPDGTMLLKIYFLKNEQYITILFTEAKRYLQIPLDEKTLSRLNEISPKGIVSWCKEGPYKKLERREIEGVIAEGFELKNPPVLTDLMEVHPYVFPFKESISRMWVDVETSLPVATELEVITNRGMLTGFQELKIETYAYDVQWDVEIDLDLFKLEIPDDYISVLPFIEEDNEEKINPYFFPGKVWPTN